MNKLVLSSLILCSVVASSVAIAADNWGNTFSKSTTQTTTVGSLHDYTRSDALPSDTPYMNTAPGRPMYYGSKDNLPEGETNVSSPVTRKTNILTSRVYRNTNEDLDLMGKDFSKRHIVLGRFNNADLSGANFRESILVESRFRGADLAGANFTDAKLAGADLANANLHGADLRNADLTATNVKGANFTGAKYNRNTFFPNGFIPERHQMILVP